MKIPCDVCEKAEAEVLCCADEAVLCKGCDSKVHSANKLCQKHQPVFLLKHSNSDPPSSSSSLSSQLPLCDTCQESKGYVFCLEDKALLCRQCDISTHEVNPYIFSHQRHLISGVKVSLQSPTENINDNIGSSRNHPSGLLPMPIGSSTSSNCDFPADKESMAAMIMDFEAASTETSAAFPSDQPHFATESHWSLDEIYDTNDFNFYELSDDGSSRISSQYK